MEKPSISYGNYFKSNMNELHSTNLHDTLTMSLQYIDSVLSNNSSTNSNLNNATKMADNLISSNDVSNNFIHDSDVVSLSDTSMDSVDQSINQKCAVVLCNKKARDQFDELFFFNFPKNLELCNKWWKICGHDDKYDNITKICSIHFNTDDFEYIYVRRDEKYYRQTILKDNIYLPSLYLQAHEYTKFTRKRKKNVEKDNLQLHSAEVIKCVVKSCKNTFVKDDKKLQFFKFPLKNKLLLKQWINNIGLHNWQPLESDRICSIHFEKDSIMNINNVYQLKKNAIPLVKPKNAFIINSKNDFQKNSKNGINTQSIENNCSTLELQNSKKRKAKECSFLNYNFKNQKPKMNETSSLIIKKLQSCSKTERIANEEKMFIPKSKNSGNNKDYIYLDMLDYGHGDLLVFEEKCIVQNKVFEFLKKNEKNEPTRIPDSILDNKHLTECYGDMQPAMCVPECENLCNYCIPDRQRKQVFEIFRTIPTCTEQNCEIAQLIKLRVIKRATGKFESCPSYYLMTENNLVKVCRLFFIRTLGISQLRLSGILEPDHYGWYSDKKTALKANLASYQESPVICIPPLTDFIKNTSNELEKDYNLYEKESDSDDDSTEAVSIEIFENIINYIKTVPRMLSVYRYDNVKKQFFETSVTSECMYTTYSQSCVESNTAPLCTRRQFRKIYNEYMKTYLKLV